MKAGLRHPLVIPLSVVLTRATWCVADVMIRSSFGMVPGAENAHLPLTDEETKDHRVQVTVPRSCGRWKWNPNMFSVSPHLKSSFSTCSKQYCFLFVFSRGVGVHQAGSTQVPQMKRWIQETSLLFSKNAAWLSMNTPRPHFYHDICT